MPGNCTRRPVLAVSNFQSCCRDPEMHLADQENRQDSSIVLIQKSKFLHLLTAPRCRLDAWCTFAILDDDQ